MTADSPWHTLAHTHARSFQPRDFVGSDPLCPNPLLLLSSRASSQPNEHQRGQSWETRPDSKTRTFTWIDKELLALAQSSSSRQTRAWCMIYWVCVRTYIREFGAAAVKSHCFVFFFVSLPLLCFLREGRKKGRHEVAFGLRWLQFTACDVMIQGQGRRRIGCDMRKKRQGRNRLKLNGKREWMEEDGEGEFVIFIKTPLECCRASATCKQRICPARLSHWPLILCHPSTDVFVCLPPTCDVPLPNWQWTCSFAVFLFSAFISIIKERQHKSLVERKVQYVPTSKRKSNYCKLSW